jgi:predicted enzyme related to lactoylglutathione lyase
MNAWVLLSHGQAKPSGESITAIAAQRDKRAAPQALVAPRRGRHIAGEVTMQNPVSHFEIYADDPSALARFYTSVFDWKVEEMPGDGNYKLVQTVDVDAERRAKQPGGINGGIMKRPDPGAPRIINYVSVESLDSALERARQLGAKVMKGKSGVPGMGWFAILSDPEGNPFALWQQDKAAK